MLLLLPAVQNACIKSYIIYCISNCVEKILNHPMQHRSRWLCCSKMYVCDYLFLRLRVRILLYHGRSCAAPVCRVGSGFCDELIGLNGCVTQKHQQRGLRHPSWAVGQQKPSNYIASNDGVSDPNNYWEKMWDEGNVPHYLFRENQYGHLKALGQKVFVLGLESETLEDTYNCVYGIRPTK